MSKKIYFLCTGNSCRSQMAEGFAKDIFGEDWMVRSAGVEMHGLNPRAVSSMKLAGIDISQQTSTLIDQDYLMSCDVVVTLCGDAKDKCPMTPPEVKRIHWPLPDPAQATGSETEIMEVFNQVRDTIKSNVDQLYQELN
ncbi:arsenate reductase (thioredoxin) [Companilactobacillus zhongbaensis]|uniref:arsenate reductase (thioredoxin) n=1 Tax=Companilactobacillus zhongbaensis TaxID=2486009 RepID=UPI000F78DD3A|nr:arsenate reductase (thioredoxin) [Companilactobacillus zhongbaensis]